MITFRRPLNRFTRNLFNIAIWHLFPFNGVLFSPLKVARPNTKKLRPDSNGFCLEIGGTSSGAFFSSTRACCSFIFGPRSFNAHVLSRFFLCFAPPQQLGQSLVLRCVEEYVHVVKALAPLASTFAS